MEKQEGQTMGKTESYIFDETDVMWMKMALMAASRAEVTKHATSKPSVGCVIRRSRLKGPSAVLSVGWNGFLPDTPEERLEAIKGRFEGDAGKKMQNTLTAELGLHAEANALQYSTEIPMGATVYVTHVPCYQCAKQLIAHKVGRVFYLYWMTGSESSIELFKERNITCIAFRKREFVLEDFSQTFLERRGILRGSTEEDKLPGECPSFVGSKDAREKADSESNTVATLQQENRKLRDELSEVKKDLAVVKQSLDELTKKCNQEGEKKLNA